MESNQREMRIMEGNVESSAVLVSARLGLGERGEQGSPGLLSRDRLPF